MATTMNTTGAAYLSAKMATYYDKVALDNLKKNLVYHGLGQTKRIPRGSGKTVQWFKRTVHAANTTELTEGTVPSAIAISATSVSATLKQYGQFTQTSDLISMTSIDDELEHAVAELGYQMSLTVDTLDRNLLDADTTKVNYTNSKTALSAVASTDVLTAADLRKARRDLAKDNVPGFDAEGNYVIVVHPNNEYDLQGDTATGGWVDARKYDNASQLFNGESGKQHGVRVIGATNVTSTTSGTSGSANVYSLHVLGRGAFGVVKFDGMGRVIVKKSGDQDTSNPLNQYSTVGWKITSANAILDGNRKVTIKAGSSQ